MKVLIPLDGSKFAEAVLEEVKRLIDLAHGETEVHLVRVIDTEKAHTTWLKAPPASEGESGRLWDASGERPVVTSHYVSAAVAVESKEQAVDRMYYEAKEYLDNIARRFFPGIAKITVILNNKPAHEITEYARRERVDLIALATHGQTGLAGLLMGRVASHLLNSRVAPVFLVRPDGLGEAPVYPED